MFRHQLPVLLLDDDEVFGQVVQARMSLVATGAVVLQGGAIAKAITTTEGQSELTLGARASANSLCSFITEGSLGLSSKTYHRGGLELVGEGQLGNLPYIINEGNISLTSNASFLQSPSVLGRGTMDLSSEGLVNFGPKISVRPIWSHEGVGIFIGSPVGTTPELAEAVMRLVGEGVLSLTPKTLNRTTQTMLGTGLLNYLPKNENNCFLSLDTDSAILFSSHILNRPNFNPVGVGQLDFQSKILSESIMNLVGQADWNILPSTISKSAMGLTAEGNLECMPIGIVNGQSHFISVGQLSLQAKTRVGCVLTLETEGRLVLFFAPADISDGGGELVKLFNLIITRQTVPTLIITKELTPDLVITNEFNSENILETTKMFDLDITKVL